MTKKAIAIPKHFTPKSMANFSRTRINRADHALQEIASLYRDVDLGVVEVAEELSRQMGELADLVNVAEEEGRMS